MASSTLWAQAELSDEEKLAALEEQAGQKAEEEEEARVLAKEEAARFHKEEAKMKALEEEAKTTHQDKEALMKAAEEEEAKLKAAEAHLKSLEFELGKKVVQEDYAVKAAHDEEAKFKAEEQKFKTLEENAARKAAEMHAIEAEEARLIADMNERNAGDDMTATAPEEDAATQASPRVLKEVPVTPGHADIFEKLVNARRAGLELKDFAAVASKGQKQASEELKQAVGAHWSDAQRLWSAFVNAEKAGVSSAEQSAERAAIVDAASKRLANASKVAAHGALMSANIRELAAALAVARSIGVNHTLLDSATEVFELQADVALKHKDMRHAETFVKEAHVADAKIPPQLVAWVKMEKRLRDLRSTMDSKDLPTVMSFVMEAHAMGLPNSSVLVAVEKAAQSWSSANLKDKLGLRSNLTEADVDDLLVEVEQAKEAGASSPDASKAAEKILAWAKSELSHATSVQFKSYDGPRLKRAFNYAQRAGVPESERIAAKAKVVTAIENELSRLIVDANSNSSSRRSHELVQELAPVFELGENFAVNETLLATVRHFYEMQGQKALSENDLSYAETLVQVSGQVGAAMPNELQGWVRMWGRLREARKTPDDRKDLLSHLLNTVVEAKSINMPNSSDFASVEAKVKTWAATNLKAAAARNTSDEESFNELLDILDTAKLAGLGKSEVAAAASKVLSRATSELTMACQTKPYDASRIKTAFINAERAGVAEATRARVEAEFLVVVERRLLAASSNSSHARTKEFVIELADAMILASRYNINQTASIHARNFYFEQGELAWKDKDFHYAELLMKEQRRAGADLPADLQGWVRVLKQLREAEALPTGSTDQLPALLDLISIAKEIGLSKNKHVAAVEAKAKLMAAADLRAEL